MGVPNSLLCNGNPVAHPTVQQRMEFLIGPRQSAPRAPDGDIVIEAPPAVKKDAPAGALARLLPVAMVVGAMGMMAVYFASGSTATRNPMVMVFPIMMLVSLIGSIAGGRNNGRATEVDQDRRDYLRYLDSLDSDLVNTVDAQRASLEWLHPEPATLWTLVGSTRMWERRPDDADFMLVRVGTGTQPLSTPLVTPELAPEGELDPVTSTALHDLIRQRAAVEDMPVPLALERCTSVSVCGHVAMARDLLRAVVLQLAVFHRPDHLRIICVVDPLTADEWDWLKWLPHHQHPDVVDDCGSTRLTYDSVASAECALETLDDAHVVVLIDNGLAVGNGEQISAHASSRITVVEIVESPSDILVVRADAGDEVSAHPDSLSLVQAVACARRLAAYQAPAAQAEGVTSVDVVALWGDLDAAESLRIPIGVSEHGSSVELDIKEAAANGMGPHGLCIGATGSGKSELLRTLTLGMIASHSSETLNVVLVDFKGGATFLGFDRAPHVAAVITNLSDEAHLVARMKDALAGEMNRRQEVLRAAGNYANIADYDKARAQGAALAPLPTLFIVVDEFSELLSQQPDFIDLFIAIGRLGRSLGMHLLLASQRLDEGRLRGLESHLSYRICLRTFSAGESRSVLGVADAYHLPNTPGAGYLKSGSGEPLRFQASFVSGPSRRAADRPAFETPMMRSQVFTAAPVGHPAAPSGKTTAPRPTSTRTVLDAVLDEVEGSGPPARQVWLPPLTESPSLDSIVAHIGTPRPLTVPIGLVDRPFEQRRDVLLARLDEAAGNVAVVGGPRTGKSTALCTLTLALAETHHPNDVQIYCLDFGGGLLSSLATLPHVGAVASRHDAELVRRTVAHVEALLRSRESQRAAAADRDGYAHVFLVIDGWSTVRQDFDSLEPTITSLAAQGLSYRIHVVLAASRWAEIRPAVKDQIGTRIELRLGDPAESEMDRKRARQLHQCPPGRGITRDGHEFVIAVASCGPEVSDRLCTRYNGCAAPPVALLPERVALDTLVPADGTSRRGALIPLGLGEIELMPLAVDFAAEAHLLVLGEAECGKTATLRTLCLGIVGANHSNAARLFIIDFRRTLLGVVESDHLACYTPSSVALTSTLTTLSDLLRSRLPGIDVSQQQLRARSWWSGPEIYVVIDDYDLVAGSAGSNPLSMLLDFLPYSKDLGLHIVVARRSGGAARAMFDPFLARLRDVGCMGLMMSASPDEGVLLGSVRPSRMPQGRGTLVVRHGLDQLVQVAWSDPA
jgi:DNA segregation ATPase FtsK/SpoIIIE, S-DNA-T family